MSCRYRRRPSLSNTTTRRLLQTSSPTVSFPSPTVPPRPSFSPRPPFPSPSVPLAPLPSPLGPS
ncbi:uncharacterized protein SCHCODRAFT_02642492, partial [Schizophyllum commune H4-8]|uniref:uncharacterized protein n=1 Tax=Schizophyllum commune (strain H4-8 / FGSC 9210) TaxID=578458 RepID=UPI00215E54C3